MRMRRCHAMQIAREMQRIENQKQRQTKEKTKRKSIFARLLGR
jgi:hypothetical protein